MSKEGSGVPSRNFRGLRSPGLPLESKLECRPTQKLSQQHPEVAAQMPGILTVCFGSQNYASSQTVFLDLKPFHIFSWTSPWGHLIEISNSSHWLSSEICTTSCVPQYQTHCWCPQWHPILPQHQTPHISWTPPHFCEWHFWWLKSPCTNSFLGKLLIPQELTPCHSPLLTFPHSSRMEWAFRELCSGVQLALVIYLWAYLSLPDCDRLPPRDSQTQVNIQIIWGIFETEVPRPSPGDSDSIGLGWNQRCWTSKIWEDSGDQPCVGASS